MDYTEPTNGITQKSKEYVTQYLPKIGTVQSVEIHWDKENIDYTTTITGTTGTINVTGFSIGYGGEGPHGLAWLLETLKVPVNAEKEIFAGLGEENVGSRKWEV